MVKCELCGKEYKVITPTHLKKSHSLTMAQYRERFPDAVLAARSDEQKAKYKQMAYDRWADPDFHAANAPRVAAQGAAANQIHQEKREADSEYNERWLAAVQEAHNKSKKHFCQDCGKHLGEPHERCWDCWKAWRLENAMHPCANPDCDVPVKGQTKYCSQECRCLDSVYIAKKQKAGRISQVKRPDNRANLKPGWKESANTPEILAKMAAAASTRWKGRPKPLEQRQKMSDALISYWREKGVTGEGHNRNPHWLTTRIRVISRDRRCLKCNKSNSFMSFPVHHLNGQWWDDRYINLATLCTRCHVIVTHGGNRWRPCRLP